MCYGAYEFWNWKVSVDKKEIVLPNDVESNKACMHKINRIVEEKINFKLMLVLTNKIIKYNERWQQCACFKCGRGWNRFYCWQIVDILRYHNKKEVCIKTPDQGITVNSWPCSCRQCINK